MKITKKIVFFLFFFQGPEAISEELNYNLTLQGDGHLYVTISNNSMKDKTIRNPFCMSIGSLKFDIENEYGDKFPLLSSVNERCNFEERIFIQVGYLTGRFFDIQGLKALYRLPEGRYKIYARLCEIDSEEDCKGTNSVIIEVP